MRAKATKHMASQQKSRFAGFLLTQHKLTSIQHQFEPAICPRAHENAMQMLVAQMPYSDL